MTREDLSPSQQAVQGMHAAVTCVLESPQMDAESTLVFLSVPDEAALLSLSERLWWARIEFSGFREPDLDGALTAIATADPRARRKLSRLPLALRGGERDE